MDLCLTLDQCHVLAFYPVWFGGPSACFAMDQTQLATVQAATGNVPFFTPDRSFIGSLSRQ